MSPKAACQKDISKQQHNSPLQLSTKINSSLQFKEAHYKKMYFVYWAQATPPSAPPRTASPHQASQPVPDVLPNVTWASFGDINKLPLFYKSRGIYSSKTSSAGFCTLNGHKSWLAYFKEMELDPGSSLSLSLSRFCSVTWVGQPWDLQKLFHRTHLYGPSFPVSRLEPKPCSLRSEEILFNPQSIQLGVRLLVCSNHCQA